MILFYIIVKIWNLYYNHMPGKYILSIDAGTTNCKAVIFNSDGKIMGKSAVRMETFYPREGWVEQNPYFIISSVKKVISEAIKNAGISVKDIESAGITNQRETTIVWDKNSGIPAYNAIAWQDRRTENIMKGMAVYRTLIGEKTGLRPDPYFSAGKIKWIIDNVEGIREKAENGDMAFGTVDSWILYNLDSSRPYATDYTNASRTMLFNIRKLEWDRELMDLFRIPESMLPEVYPSLHTFGTISLVHGKKIPVYSIIGDQQSALFGHAAISKGMAKNTYGTGSFMLANSGSDIPEAGALIGTVAYGLENKKVSYAIEGSIFSAGSAIDWTKKLLNVKSYSKFEEMALKARNSSSYLVPAFTGLGSPYWDPSARGIIIGLSHSTGRNEMARMAYESVAYHTEDVLLEIEKIAPVKELKVDGGLTNSQFLMQFQADLSGHKIIKTDTIEITATGTAYIAGIASGFWKLGELQAMSSVEREYYPDTGSEKARKGYMAWKRAVTHSFGWEI